jgi:amino acid transporter
MSQTGPYGQDAGRDPWGGPRVVQQPPDGPGPSPPPPGGYGAGPPHPGPPPSWQLTGRGPAPTNGLAIAALVVAFVFAPAGLVMGIVAKHQIAQSGEEGDGLATAAIAVSATLIVLYVIGIIAFVAFAASVVSHFPNGNTGFPGNTGSPSGNTFPGGRIGVGLELLFAH